MLAVIISVFGSALLIMSNYQMGGGDWFDLIVAKEFSKGITEYYTSEFYYGPFFPLLTSITFYVFGANPVYVTFLNLLMLALLPLIIFLVFYSMFRDENFALLTSIIFLIVIVHQTAYWNEFFYVTSFFMGLALLFSFLSFKINKKGMYLLALITLLLFGQIKLEYMIVIPAFLLSLLIFRRNDFTSLNKFASFMKDKFLIPAIIFLVLIGTYIAKYYHVWGAWHLHDAFQLSHLPVSSNGFLYFWATSLNIYLTFLFIIGVVYAFIFKKYRKEMIFLLSFFIFHNIPYLLHYNGYQGAYGILTYMPYILVSGFGVYSASKILNEKLKLAGYIIPAILMVLFLSYYALLLNTKESFGFGSVHNTFSEFALNDCELEIAGVIDGCDNTLIIVQGSEYEGNRLLFLTLCKMKPLSHLITDSDVYRNYTKMITDKHPDIFSAPKYSYDEDYFRELENLGEELYD
ncbi:MAG: hypothetical protein KAW40_02500, partial [Candidatus Aenigmarchaeota archaeon]|nr:hypothetical protein [Candidatus Aenigmarchaeota archaeon]